MDVKGEQTINFNKFTEGDGSVESENSVDFMLNYGVYRSSSGTTSAPKTTKVEKGKSVPVKAVIGPKGDSDRSAYGKEGASGYRPSGYQFLDFLDGSAKLYASSATVIALAANTLY